MSEKLTAADVARIVETIAAAAEQRGYDKAVANLRDDETALAWMNQGEHRRRFVSPYDRESLALYLEAQRDQP